MLTQAGDGDFTWGYFGGLLDAATGLIYVGSGQYYDPATGRFLSRFANPGATNPYLPQRDPLGALLGPAVLLFLLQRRRKKPGKYDHLLIGLVLLLGFGLGLAACGTGSPPSAPPSLPPSGSPPPSGTPGDGTLDSEALEALYNANPDQALLTLQQKYNIQLPTPFHFAFAYNDSGIFQSIGVEPLGYVPWFFDFNWSTYADASIRDCTGIRDPD